jgi:hypothetical protein
MANDEDGDKRSFASDPIPIRSMANDKDDDKAVKKPVTHTPERNKND